MLADDPSIRGRGPSMQDNPRQFAPQLPNFAPWGLVRKCRHRLDAIRLCIQLSGLSNDEVCRRLGIDPSHFTRMMQGRASFPDAKSIELMTVAGNYAPLQYEATACGFRLVPQDSAQETLRERLEVGGI